MYICRVKKSFLAKKRELILILFMKKLVLTILIFIQSVVVFAQTSGVRGKVIDSKTQKPLQNVITSIANTNLMQVTDAEGKFVFKDVAVGNQILQIKSQGYKDQLLKIEIEKGKIIDIGVAVLDEDITEEQQLSLVTITDNDLGDDSSGSENTAGLLQASRDVFQQAAAFNWGQARFRIRGIDNEYGNILINGITMNKILDGRPQFGNWGGLNDATRNQEFTNGSNPNDYIFGGILGTQEINTRASLYRKGSRVSFSGTNTNYSWRAMGTHVSGMDKNGWAFVVSGSRRWANEGYFEGTNYAANSFFASVEKRINANHSLNFTSIYAQNKRAGNSPNSKEVTDLAGINYNSYWGEQNGKQRSARGRELEEPILMLEHFWKIGKKSNLNTTLSYQFGKFGRSRLDFQGVDNPNPVYYRNLPSYFTSQYNEDTNAFEGDTPQNVTNAENARVKFLANKQINWGQIYESNKTNEGRSLIVLYEDRVDDNLVAANSVFSTSLSDNIVLNAGATFKSLKSRNFQNLQDLLGGQYFKDIETFGKGDQQQSDLNNPNRNVVEGDKYGYNYNMNATTIDAFTQFKFTYKKIDFYTAQTFSRAEYQREGLYKNGYYPTNSLGKGKRVSFENFGFKGGLTYKISGRQFLNFNGLYQTKAPSMRNVFPNARVSNNTTINIVPENITSGDASWIMNLPKMKVRLTGYFSKIKNSTRTTFFFADGADIVDGDPSTDDSTGDFLAETLTGLNRKNIGAELGFEYQITSTLKATLAGSYGEFTFDSNPNVSYTKDLEASSSKTNPIVSLGTSSMRGYRQGGTPQQAATLGLEYRDPKFWWVGANINYLGNNYLEIAPILRTKSFFIDNSTETGAPFPEATQERAKLLLKQEKFKDFNLLNLTGGKSWRIKGDTFGFFASINNVLDTTYKTGGFEQARNASFRELNNDFESGTPPFAPQYFYGFGRSYFLNLYLNF
jgi:CarboxypepD_reg-like domain